MRAFDRLMYRRRTVDYFELTRNIGGSGVKCQKVNSGFACICRKEGKMKIVYVIGTSSRILNKYSCNCLNQIRKNHTTEVGI
jgi:hypothetical protein